MSMRKISLWLLIAALALALGACGSKQEDGTNSNPQGQNQSLNSGDSANTGEDGEQAPDPADDKKTAYPLTVNDATGTEVTFEEAPQRIVSTSPSETEILFALGLGDRIVGVSDFDNYPEEALEKPKMGGVSKPNEEAIIAAAPDLVIGGISMKEDVAEQLRQLEIKLYKTEPKNLEEVLDSILQIGVITDAQEQAEELVAQMRAEIDKVKSAAADIKEEDRKKVYIEFAPGWTVGKGEFMDELITLAGGLNIASDLEGWNQINEEKVIVDDPDVILFAAEVVDYETGEPLEQIIKSRSGWDKLKAIQDGRMVALNEDMISRTGPRITQALLQIFEGIYPELAEW